MIYIEMFIKAYPIYSEHGDVVENCLIMVICYVKTLQIYVANDVKLTIKRNVGLRAHIKYF